MFTISSTTKLAAILVLSVTAACGDDTTSGSAPTVRSNSPASGATGVPINQSISVTFSEAMDRDSLTTSSFTLQSDTAVPVAGTVIYANSTAVFWPSAYLPVDGSFTAEVSTEAASEQGVGLAANHRWTFTAGSTLAPGLPVDLGTAGGFAILAKTAVSTVPTSAVTGDVGVSPAAASYITGFALTAMASNVSATSVQVTGNVYAADYAAPTPVNMTTSVRDMEIAFVDAAGRASDVTELGAGNIGGMTLAPGVYKWSSGLQIPTNLTLNGDASAVWIFQVAQNLTMAAATSVVLTGGAQAKNVFWQVAGSVEVGTTAHLEGVVLAKTAITLRTGSSIVGRLLAQTAVSIDGSTVVEPAE